MWAGSRFEDESMMSGFKMLKRWLRVDGQGRGDSFRLFGVLNERKTFG